MTSSTLSKMNFWTNMCFVTVCVSTHIYIQLFQNKFKFSSWFKVIVKCCSFQNIPVQCKKTFWSMDAYTQQSIICAFMPTFFVGKPPSPWSGKTSMAWPKKRQHWLFQMQFRFVLWILIFFSVFKIILCLGDDGYGQAFFHFFCRQG